MPNQILTSGTSPTIHIKVIDEYYAITDDDIEKIKASPNK